MCLISLGGTGFQPVRGPDSRGRLSYIFLRNFRGFVILTLLNYL